MLKSKRIWQILSSPELGGGELVALKLAESLGDAGKKTGVISAGPGPAEDYAVDHGINYDSYPLGQCSSNSYIKSLVGNIRSAVMLAKKRGDLLHFHSPFVYRLLYKILRLFRCGPIVVHIHIEYQDKKALAWALQYPPDVIVVCAKFLETFIRDCLPPAYRENQRIEVLSNAVDLNVFYPEDRTLAKKKIGLDGNVPIILMVADLSPHKGQRTVVKALSQLKAKGISAKFWMVGRARAGCESYEAELRSMVEGFGLTGDVFFAGHRSDVPQLMRAADCLVLPSVKEGLPLSILEAQASKLPVISTPISGIPEIITDGETGFLLQADDVDGYAEKIALMLEDQRVASKLAQRAFDNCVKERSWNAYVRRVLKLYDDIC